jgi:hypothetical protein
VGQDLLVYEWPEVGSLPYSDLYLVEAASIPETISGVTYDPEQDGQPLTEPLGLHEHWNAAHEYTEKISFTPIQCNADVAELTWGADWVEVETQTGAIHAKHHAGTLEPVVVVIETTPRTNIVKRYCGTFQLTERGEVTLDGSSVDGRSLTFNAIADANGVTMHEYTAFTN